MCGPGAADGASSDGVSVTGEASTCPANALTGLCGFVSDGAAFNEAAFSDVPFNSGAFDDAPLERAAGTGEETVRGVFAGLEARFEAAPGAFEETGIASSSG